MSSFTDIEPLPWNERGPWLVFARVQGATDTRYGRTFRWPSEAWRCIYKTAEWIIDSPDTALRPGETLLFGVIDLALPTNDPVLAIELTARPGPEGVMICQKMATSNFEPWLSPDGEPGLD